MVSKFRPSPIGRVLGAGGCEVMYALRSYADENGDHRCDVFNPEGAICHYNCPVFNGNTNKIGAPLTPWTGDDLASGKYPLVIALSRSGGRGPIILGRVDNPSIYYEPSTTGPNSKPASQNGNVGAPASVTVDDVVIQNDDTRLILRDKKFGNDAYIVSARNIELVTNNGQVIISKDSDADDGPVLATPYKNRDDALVEYCTAMTEWANQMLKWARTVPVPATPVDTLVLTGPPTAPSSLDPTTVRSAVLRLASDVESDT
jgi:hypothetical protein